MGVQDYTIELLEDVKVCYSYDKQDREEFLSVREGVWIKHFDTCNNGLNTRQEPTCIFYSNKSTQCPKDQKTPQKQGGDWFNTKGISYTIQQYPYHKHIYTNRFVILYHS
jgi:hypothetical protein